MERLFFQILFYLLSTCAKYRSTVINNSIGSKLPVMYFLLINTFLFFAHCYMHIHVSVSLVCLFVFVVLLLQASFLQRLTGDNKSEKFFKVIYERMKLAQQEIKATVTVNTSDLGNKKKDEDSSDKDTQGCKKGQRSRL